MKRIIAGIIAMTAVMGILTGCGKDAADDAEENTTVETTAVSEEEATTAEEETTGEKTEADVSDVSCEDVIYEFIDAYNAQDYKKTFEMQMPDDIMKVIDFSVKYDEKEKRNADEIIRESQRKLYGNADDEHIEVKIKNITEKEPMTDKELLDLKYSFGMYAWMIKFVDEKGNDPDFDNDRFEEEITNTNTNDFLELSDISDGYRVEMELENEKTGYTYEGNIYVMNYKGKWKINAKYILGSNMINSLKPLEGFARSIYNAQNSAIVEMDEECAGIGWKDCFIICSDESKDYNVPDEFERDIFMKKIRRYFDAIDKTEWFSVIYNGISHTVAYVKDKPETIETFPDLKYDKEEIISAMGEKISDDMSFDERYNICVDVIKNKTEE